MVFIMRPDSHSVTVVDDQLRVGGLEELFIADSSVILSIPSTNICAATMMIVEKTADRYEAEAELDRSTSLARAPST